MSLRDKRIADQPDTLHPYSAIFGFNKFTGEIEQIELDGGSLPTISHEHAKVHDGGLFACGYLNAAVANNGNIDLWLKASATHSVHTYIKVIAGGDATFEYFKATTVTADGTPCTPLNHNETSSNTPELTVFHTPTIDVLGAVSWPEKIVGGTGGITPGAIQTPGSEQVVIPSNANRLFRMTNTAGTTQPLQIILSFYEVPHSA